MGESVKIIRELQGFSQNELAELTGIPQSTISAIEHDKINWGIERAKITANRPLKNYLRCRYGVKNRLKMLIYYA